MKRQGVNINGFRALGLLAAMALPLSLMGIITSPKEQVRELNSDTVAPIEQIMHRVLELNRRGEFKQAIDILSAALITEKDNALLRTFLAQTLDLYLEEQIRAGQKQILENRKDVEAYVRVASGIELLGEKPKAMEVLLTGIATNYDAAPLWMAIAKLELKSGRSHEALDVFKEVIRIDGSNADALNNAAYILSTRDGSSPRDLSQAEKFAENARELDPTNAQYVDTLATVHYKKGNRHLALSLIKEAIRLAPQDEAFKSQLERFSLDAPTHNP